CADLGNAAFKEQGDAATGDVLVVCGNDGHTVELDVAQEAVLEVRTAIQVKDDAVGFYRDRGEDNAVAGRGRLALLVEHFLVSGPPGPEGAVCHQHQVLTQGQGAMRKALLRHQI